MISNRVLRNTLALFTGQTGAQLLALVFTAYLTKRVSADEYGALSFAFNFAVVFNVLSEYGLWTLLVRNIARDPATGRDYFWNSLALKFTLTIIAAVVGWATLQWFYPAGDLRRLSYLAGGWVLFNAWYFSAAAVFRAFQEHHLDGTLSFAGKLLYVSAGLIILHTLRDIRWIAIVFTLAMAVQCGVAIALVLRRHPQFQFTYSLKHQLFLLRHSWLFFVITVFTTLHLKFALLVIGKVCPQAEIGYYNVASMLVLVPIVLANAFVQSMYPVLSECHERGDNSFWDKVRLGVRWLAALAFPVIFYMTVDGGRILTGVFRKEFVAGLVPLQILLWGLGLDFFNPFSGHVLYVLNQQARVIAITAASVATNIIANLILVPRYGIIGASCAMVISLSVMFWGYAWSLRRWLSLPVLLGQIAQPLLVAAALAPLAWWLRSHVPFVINGAIYCGACAGVYFGLGVLQWRDLQMFAGHADTMPLTEPDTQEPVPFDA